MQSLRDLSIQTKLNLITLVISGAAVLLACGMFLLHDDLATREAFLDHLRVDAGMIGSASTAAISFKDPQAAAEILQNTVAQDKSISRAAVLGVDGTVLAHYTRPGTVSRAPLALDVEHRFDDEELTVARPVRLEGQSIGRVLIEKDLSELRTRQHRYLGIVAAVFLISTLLTFLLSTWLHRVISGPIGQVAALARRVSIEKDYALRVPGGSGDELGQLVAGVNEMLAQIQARDTELARHRDHLEEQVSDRTHSLTALNAELRSVNETLEAARMRAEAGAAAKSMFLANMSHEIRTPMNGILGMAQLLQDSPMSAEQASLLDKLVQSANALLTIINDILDFSKIEAGKLTLEEGELQLRQTVGVAVDSLALVAREKRVELITRVQPDVPEWLLGDAGRLRQVLLNLIGNAVKFTARGEVLSSVMLESRTDTDVTVRFSVKDTGIGIPESARKAIFKPFEQADGSTTRRHGGTGLGLTIASQLIGLMGGRIKVESEEGKGSTFSFTVTLKVPPAHKLSADQEEARKLVGSSVLVVESNATQRDVLEETLGTWGIRSRAASGAEDALAQLSAARAGGTPIDVALIDSELPGIDGFSLAERIHQEPGLARAMVLLLPPTGILDRAGRPARPGIRSYVSKPINVSDLLVAMLIAVGVRPVDVAPVDPSPGSRLPAPSRRLSLLVAEDNLINQEFIRYTLQRQGHSVTMVENGQLAVEALSAPDAGFDAVLMDLSMPVMGGLEATAEVRRREAGERKRRIPIVALTAHALKGDRDRCLEAGMDGYVSKPIDIEELNACLDSLLSPTPAPPAPASAVAAEPPPPLSVEDLLPRFSGDAELLASMVQMYFEQVPLLSAEASRALATNDAAALATAVHKLRGSTMLFGHTGVDEASLALELKAQSGDLDGARRTLGQLGVALESLSDELFRLNLSA